MARNAGSQIRRNRLESHEQDVGRSQRNAMERQRSEDHHPAVGNFDAIFAADHSDGGFLWTGNPALWVSSLMLDAPADNPIYNAQTSYAE